MAETLKAKPRKALIVEDSRDWRDELLGIFRGAGIKANAVTNLDAAIEALQKGDYTEVVTDGLRGKWEDVVVVARGVGLPVKLVSANSTFQSKAEEQNIPFINKGRINPEDLTG